MKTKPKYIALILVLAATGFAGSSVLNKRDEKKQSNLSVQAANAKRIKILIPVGAIHIFADAKGKATAHVVRTIGNNPTESQRRWLRESVFSLEQRGDLIVVEDRPLSFKGTGKANLDIELHVPANLVAELEVSTGEVEMEGRYAKITANVTTGEFKLGPIECGGELDANVQTGELRTKLNSIPKKSSKLSVGTGELSLVVPSGKALNLSATINVGEISNSLSLTGATHSHAGIGQKLSGSIAGGGTRFDLKVGTGEISVSAGK